jgi:hypothetical protein
MSSGASAALSSIFRNQLSKQQRKVESAPSFVFDFLNSEDVAASLLAEEELRDMETRRPGACEGTQPKGKKRGKRGKKSKLPIPSPIPSPMKQLEEAKEENRQEQKRIDREDAAGQTTVIMKKESLLEKTMLSADEMNSEATAVESSENTAKKPVFRPDDLPKGEEEPSLETKGSLGLSVRKKTRRGGKKARHRNGHKAVVDSDEDWYDPQSYFNKEVDVLKSRGIESNPTDGTQKGDTFFFQKAAKGDGRNLVAIGPTKVRNSAWNEEKGVMSHDSPFAFGFQFTI